MNFLVCDQPFVLSGQSPYCPGNLDSITAEQIPIPGLLGPGLTWEETKEIQDYILLLFLSVFVFLVLKKVL